MARVPFAKLMEAAQRGGYAVGYFESWSLESLAAVAEAAESTHSPVILGFSGIYLPHPDRAVRDRLSWYFDLGRSVCDSLSVPCCLLFNESPDRLWVEEAIGLGFDLVMFTDERLPPAAQAAAVAEIAGHAHARGAAVEGELAPLPGAGTGTVAGGATAGRRGDEPEDARRFVAQTGVDALAVDIGQSHLHGRRLLPLDQERLRHIRRAVDVPLVLHGASSVEPAELREAIRGGISKINVGSVLKRSFFEAMRAAAARYPESSRGYNPYEVVGSGLSGDVLTAGRIALRDTVAELMQLFGSAGRAEEPGPAGPG